MLCTGKFFLPFLSSEVNVSPYPGTEVPGFFFFLVQFYSNQVVCAEILVRNSYASHTHVNAGKTLKYVL